MEGLTRGEHHSLVSPCRSTYVVTVSLMGTVHFVIQEWKKQKHESRNLMSVPFYEHQVSFDSSEEKQKQNWTCYNRMKFLIVSFYSS